jgi:NAD(P)-dependent dehydrogenase (short-subunit alcohol dehydrogenase family)
VVRIRFKKRPRQPGPSAYSLTSSILFLAYSESLAQEVYQFNIRVLIVEPGAFKTKTVKNTQFRCDNPHPDYDNMRAIFHKMVAVLEDQAYHGDPRKGMEVLVDIVKGEGKAKGRDMPSYVFLGESAHEAVKKQIETIGKTAEEWKDITSDLNFDSLSTK